MNFTLDDSITGRQRCRQWTPLITQQLRVRHLYQVFAYNLVHEDTNDGFYYTLHTTAMCAPFYTSETINSGNPKWAEMVFSNVTNSSCTAFVIRLWHKSTILLAWGVNLSGLIYLGNKISDLQPESFADNTVIFHLRGGFFTSLKQLRTDLQKPLPFIDHLNVDLKPTYNIEKLRKLHSLQISIKNRSIAAQFVRDKINMRNGTVEVARQESVDEESGSSTGNGTVRYAPQLLTMTSLNKMLQEKPTKVQKQEIIRIRKEIEISKLKTKILMQERDRKQAWLRHLKLQYGMICENNEDRTSDLMLNYRHLNKEVEMLREWKKELLNAKDALQHFTRKLQNRRRQLMSELLFLYPVEKIDERFTINGEFLPSSDMLTDCSDGGLSIALGYVSHILIMCASILQVPLRYPIQHFGSRSVIEDHISSSLNDRSREFPLYTKGKDRMQFNYAVYLLNKNIAQYLYLLGARTPDLKATLPNVLTLLQGKEHRYETTNKSIRPGEPSIADSSSVCSQETIKFDPDHLNNSENRRVFVSHVSDPILDSIRHECQIERSQSPTRRRISRTKMSNTGPGLSQILAIPEMYLNNQMSSSTFESYMKMKKKDDALKNCIHPTDDLPRTPNTLKQAILPDIGCDTKKETNIEQAKEMIAPEMATNRPIEIYKNGTEQHSLLNKSKRLSRSVGSYTDEELSLEIHNNLEMGSDPLLNVSALSNTSKNYDVNSLPGDNEVAQQMFLQEWLESGPALVCSDENLYPEEILGITAHSANSDSPLTVRTDALLKTKSFNLVKPKF